jgi:hypothetical protein
MMNRRDALLLVDRLKRRTRDPDVLTLCEYVHGTIPAFRRPGDGTAPNSDRPALELANRDVGQQLSGSACAKGREIHEPVTARSEPARGEFWNGSHERKSEMGMKHNDINEIESFFHCGKCVREDRRPNIAIGVIGTGTHLQVLRDSRGIARNVRTQRADGAAALFDVWRDRPTRSLRRKPHLRRPTPQPSSEANL